MSLKSRIARIESLSAEDCGNHRAVAIYFDVDSRNGDESPTEVPRCPICGEELPYVYLPKRLSAEEWERRFSEGRRI